MAFNPAKEETQEPSRTAEQNDYVLPDGNQITVSCRRRAVPMLMI